MEENKINQISIDNTALNYDKEYIFREEEEHLQSVLALMRERIKELKNNVDRKISDRVDFHNFSEVLQFQAAYTLNISRKEERNILESRLANPYFGRMLLLDGKEQFDLYIGQDIIIIGNIIIVYSHNSPVGNKIYEKITGTIKYKEYTYKVMFRRKLNIVNGVLNKVFQDFTYGDNEKSIVFDEFLASILEKKKFDNRLTDIISSIQINQNEIITRPANENMIVQGCAGSGKTMILLQRLEYLNFNRMINLSKTVILVPSTEFKEHIEPVCRDLRITRAKSLTLAEYYFDKINLYINTKKLLKNTNLISDRGYECYARYYYSDEFLQSAHNEMDSIAQNWARSVREHKLKEAEWERVCERCREFKLDKPKKAEFVGSIYPPVITLPKHGANIMKERIDNHSLLKCELYATLLLNYIVFGATINLKEQTEDSYLYIDEGQDITLNEYKLINAVNNNNAIINIFGDINQKIETGINSWEELSEICGFSKFVLNENYRNTKEITNYLNSKFNNNILALGLSGEEVKQIPYCDIIKYINENETKRIAVIVSSRNEKAIEMIKKDSLLATFLHNVEESKGLEFEKVFVIDEFMTANEKYIAYSRALESLYIIKECF